MAPASPGGPVVTSPAVGYRLALLYWLQSVCAEGYTHTLLTEPSQLLIVFLFFETRVFVYYVSQAGANPQSLSLSLPSDDINGVHHHSRPFCCILIS